MIRLKPKWDYCGNKLNKRFKRDSQRAAFLPCVGFGDYGVMLKVSSKVGCPLSGRYVLGESRELQSNI